MNCQEARERLGALVDGELPAAEAAEVQAHLDGCQDCRDEKRRQEQFTTSVKSSLGDLKPSEVFVKKVAEKLASPAAPEKGSAPAGRNFAVSLAAAGLVIAAALAGIFHLRSRQPRGAGSFAVAAAAGQAQICTDGQTWREVRVGQAVPESAGITVGPEGRLALIFDGEGGCWLGAGTAARLEPAADGAGIVLRLDSGAASLMNPSARLAGVQAGAVRLEPAAGAALAVELLPGSAELSVTVDKGVVRVRAPGFEGELAASAGEFWILPADGSGAPRPRKRRREDPAPREETP